MLSGHCSHLYGFHFGVGGRGRVGWGLWVGIGFDVCDHARESIQFVHGGEILSGISLAGKVGFGMGCRDDW